ncbi:valine-tRNA ligase [Sporothrix schenckii ATCC 58251]|uniref:Valine--tRNA ligase, mitochondrial n=1 Tax=Sporothrix schenckii (strain ATCC 58251 / de Perez 2211183) TaxID=1391915 RepID=U7PZA0_SPOS1|nr:valine-tRNA ligase [Sporothrix schenckii ATCC 58251]
MATNPSAEAPPAQGDAAAAAAPKVKSDKEAERDRKKAEKLAKFQQKQAAQKAAAAANTASAGPAAAAAAGEKKAKAKAPKAAAAEETLAPYTNDTPAGEKKRLRSFDDPYYKSYNPVAVESAWYEYWEKAGFFEPQFGDDGQESPNGRFVISHPPPNVTGSLHMGHALGDSLQDIMIRYYRMKGKTTLWLPGCDHAGIATQSVVETMLYRREGKTRHDLGRDAFIKTVWDWKTQYHANINNALRKMGGSFDWSREAFTMDENLSAAVQETFVRLHEEGTIFRANRLVNWDSKLNTALSNLEVNNKELTGRTLLDVPGYAKKVEFGVIVYFKYQIAGSDETIEVATTRLETMLGDTGIAVHPQDERYKHLVGKRVVHPFIPDRVMTIVADDYVDREFGSGAVKITPAHDANDFAIGERHKLEFINILTDDGLINENGGPYAGQKRFDVRYAVAEDLKKLGLYVDKKDNPMVVPLSERSKDVVEPRLKPQWWMRMGEMAQMAVQALDDKQFKIKPESADRSFRHWMANITDWCISRQLWWGHQCPVYLAHIEGEEESDAGDNTRWFAAKTEAEARAKATKAFPGKTIRLVRDEDVLDTWFSSGLWPFSTLGWPKATPDFEKLFPTSMLETGWDILFFWIARMVMLSLKLTGKVPFYEVYCHPLVRDSDGRKMSKSLGNVISPLDVISGISLEALNESLLKGNLDPQEVQKAIKYQKTAFPAGIPECGADGLRMCLANYVTGSGDINFDIKVMHAYRRFCNKIWNASKFVLGNIAAHSTGAASFQPRATRTLGGDESLAELWILAKMNKAAKEIGHAVEEREFKNASNALYNFWYAELCDVFIENSKTIIAEGTPAQRESALQTLYSALETALLLSHPFLPFITEELWQRLPRRPQDATPSIVVAPYPEHDTRLDNPAAEAAYQLVLDASRGIRSLVVEYPLPKDAAVDVFVQTTNDDAHATATQEVPAIRSLLGKAGGSARITVLPPGAPRPVGCVAVQVSGAASVFLHVKGHVDLDAEIKKAQTKLSKASANAAKTRKLVGDATYKEKVAAATQEADQQRLAEQESEVQQLEQTVQQFEALKLE